MSVTTLGQLPMHYKESTNKETLQPIKTFYNCDLILPENCVDVIESQSSTKPFRCTWVKGQTVQTL